MDAENRPDQRSTDTALRVIFAGTPEFAVPSLSHIARSRHRLVLVLTQPDRPSGRGMKLVASPVKQTASSLGVRVEQPRTLKDPSVLPMLQSVSADIMIVAAYGLILPQAVLDVPRLGALNVHASLLPRWRGAAPIQRALIEGDLETGVAIMKMDAGLDTGPVFRMQAVPISGDDTGGTLSHRLAVLGADMIGSAIDAVAAGQAAFTPQSSNGVTYAGKIQKTDPILSFHEPAARLCRVIRAFNPSPGASTHFGEEPIKVWMAEPVVTSSAESPGTVIEAGPRLVVACGEGAISITELQRAGGKRLRAREFLAGSKLAPGATLGGGA